MILPKAMILKNPGTFLHISFNANLAGLWEPRLPAGSEIVSDGPFKEPMVPRISLAPTIEGCFAGVYANIYQLFEKKNYPHMYFSVYAPIWKGTERVWTAEEMTRTRAVWDAHYTQELAVLDPIQMERIGEVKVFNTNNLPTKMIHPFNDPSLAEQSAGPDGIKYTWATLR